MKIKLIPSTFCIERSCFCYFSYCKQISSIKQQLINIITLACLNLYLSHRGFLGFPTPTLPQPSGIPLEMQVNVCLLRPLSPLEIFPIILLSWVWLFFETTHFQSSNNSGRKGRGPEGLQKLPPPHLLPSYFGWKIKKITEGSKADRANNTTPLFP